MLTFRALAILLLAGPASAQPAPHPLSILDVPFISQSEALCGGAAAAMVLRFWGERGLTAESFAHLLDRSAAGIRTDRLVDDLNGRGWKTVAVEGTSDAMAGEMARGRPVLTLIEDRPGTFHYVVVVATMPQAIVFHDPARSPFRVMDRAQFERRWSSARRWMAVIVPAAPVVPVVPVVEPVGDDSPCAGLIARGVQQAQAGDLASAERSLTMAISCGGSAPLRELAGVRLLQRRWPEVRELSTAALEVDVHDAHAWELLATSRFIEGDPIGSLAAWNQIGQPHVDLTVVGGLTRTRQRVVERLLAVPPQALLTPRLFTLTTRRARELPSAFSTRLEFVPMASGVAEMRAHVAERPVIPSDVWSYGAIGLLAAARNEVRLTTGAVTGGGERVSAGWRFWPGRPRVDLEVVAPAPWGGLWGVDGFAERQPFVGDMIPSEQRRGVGATFSNWVAPWLRVSARGGVDDWEGRGHFGTLSTNVQLASTQERIVAAVEGVGWAGQNGFGSASIAVRMRSSTARQGHVFVARAGAGAMSATAPPDIWFAGDTGQTRSVLLRAHPVIDDGRLDTGRIGTRIGHVSVEGQRWWSAALIRFGAAAFVDAARVGDGLVARTRGDVDAGVGLRVAVPGLDGVFRLDVAKGLADGATAVSFVYEP